MKTQLEQIKLALLRTQAELLRAQDKIEQLEKRVNTLETDERKEGIAA